jgi:hypothetical protein
MAGYSNGSGREPERDDKVASLEDARRRAKARAAASRQLDRRPRSARDLAVGGVLLAMAVAMMWNWLAPLFGGPGLVR